MITHYSFIFFRDSRLCRIPLKVSLIGSRHVNKQTIQDVTDRLNDHRCLDLGFPAPLHGGCFLVVCFLIRTNYLA